MQDAVCDMFTCSAPTVNKENTVSDIFSISQQMTAFLFRTSIQAPQHGTTQKSCPSVKVTINEAI
jgi:hypothetical protein